MTENAGEQFDSLSYWKARHEQYLLNSQGVGNAVLDQSENDRIYRGLQGYVASLLPSLRLPEHFKVLDLGCGIGMMAGIFIDSGAQYTGVDVSETALNIAREKYPKGNYLAANIADIPLHDKYDVIVERTVFIHLVEDRFWKSVLREVKRLLSTNGIFIIMDELPRGEEDAPRPNPHVRFRTYGEYEEALQRCDLRFNLELRSKIGELVKLSPHTHFVTHAE